MTSTPAVDVHQPTEAEKQEYRNFGLHHVRSVARPLPPTPIWHYTSAEALVEILKQGKLFSTQISCLNDSRERLYFGDLILDELQKRVIAPTDSRLEVLYKVAIAAMSNRDFNAAGYFVACFSEAEDELSQWKGYGGGEAGYAIGFDPIRLLEAANGLDAFVFPMSYNATLHSLLVQDICANAERFFLEGLSRGRTDAEQWARNFLFWFSLHCETFTCTAKHPKFEGEKERRLAVYLGEDHRGALVFKPKRTLLARHLPLDLTVDVDGKRLLPISHICIGPGSGQKSSKVAVHDLLALYGYKDVKVELSTIPYRTV